MKIFASFLFLIVFSFSLLAQTSPEILATANNQNFTTADLTGIVSDPPVNIGENYEKRAQIISELRTELLAQQLADVLLEVEAAALKTTVEKLVAAEMKRRVPDPTEPQIKAIYDANQTAIGNHTMAEVRPQIVSFLRREPEQKALMDYIGSLKTKHKVVIGKDVNTPNLKPTDILATIGLKSVTVQSFEERARPQLRETQAEIYDQAEDALEQTIFLNLIGVEAKARNIQPEDLIAREVSDKMKDFSPEEREMLSGALQKQLFQKYNVKFLLKEPAGFAQKISVDDDPLLGSATAPVTVVMFSDFQCPACSATHPVLQKVLAQYGDKIRFVVRDYPLEMHKNAFKAAQAADAANAQGKFFEYTELLYKNQDSLDTASLKRFAGELGLNQKQFDADLDSGKFADEVKKDMQDGAAYGVGGTPTIFVNGVKVRQLSPRAFRRAIDRALKN